MHLYLLSSYSTLSLSLFYSSLFYSSTLLSSTLLSFTLLFIYLTLPISAFHLSVLSEVWLLNFIWQDIYYYMIHSSASRFHVQCTLYVTQLSSVPGTSPPTTFPAGLDTPWTLEQAERQGPKSNLDLCHGIWSHAAMAPPVDRLSSRSVEAFLAWVVYSLLADLAMPWILQSDICSTLIRFWFLTSAKQYIKALSSQRYTLYVTYVTYVTFNSEIRLRSKTPDFCWSNWAWTWRNEHISYHHISHIHIHTSNLSGKSELIFKKNGNSISITSISSIKSSSYQVSWVSRLQGSPHQDATLQSHEQMCRSWQFWKYRNKCETCENREWMWMIDWFIIYIYIIIYIDTVDLWWRWLCQKTSLCFLAPSLQIPMIAEPDQNHRATPPRKRR